MAAGAAVSIAGGIAKSISGAKRAKAMKKALEEYKRQDLENSVRDKVGVSTMGSDLQREEASRAMASSVDALGAGGVRGVVGGMGMLNASNNMMQRQIGADLDRQKQAIDMAAAQDDSRIRDMKELRDRENLAGMGKELNNARQDLYSGIGDVGQGLMSVGGAMQGMEDGGKADTPQMQNTPTAGGQQQGAQMQQPQNAQPTMATNPYTPQGNPFAPTNQQWMYSVAPKNQNY